MKYKKEDLEVLILEENLSYKEVGRRYGVSDTMIKKIALNFGIKLPKRREINKCENFSHKGFRRDSKVFLVTDDTFKEIIETSNMWTEIGKKLGYNSSLSSNVKKAIEQRCLELNINLNSNFYQHNFVLNKTKGELFEERKNWQSARSSMQKDARRMYFEHTQNPKCAICGYDKHIEVAHIKSVSDFDDNTKISIINSVDNLIGLCPNHHWEYDNGILKL